MFMQKGRDEIYSPAGFSWKALTLILQLILEESHFALKFCFDYFYLQMNPSTVPRMKRNYS